MDSLPPLERAIRIAGSETKLAAAIGYSQVAINKARRRGGVSARMALAVHRFTAGAVPASLLRPDLWARPQDVPIVGARGRKAGSQEAGAKQGGGA